MSHRVRFSEALMVLGFLACSSACPLCKSSRRSAAGSGCSSSMSSAVPERGPTCGVTRTPWKASPGSPRDPAVLRSGTCSSASATRGPRPLGRQGWAFYRPGVRYLFEGDRADQATRPCVWVEPARCRTWPPGGPRGGAGIRDRLKQRGIARLVRARAGRPASIPTGSFPGSPACVPLADGGFSRRLAPVAWKRSTCSPSSARPGPPATRRPLPRYPLPPERS